MVELLKDFIADQLNLSMDTRDELQIVSYKTKENDDEYGAIDEYYTLKVVMFYPPEGKFCLRKMYINKRTFDKWKHNKENLPIKFGEIIKQYDNYPNKDQL